MVKQKQINLIGNLRTVFHKAGANLDAEDLADILWLATNINRVEPIPQAPASEAVESPPTETKSSEDDLSSESPPTKEGNASPRETTLPSGELQPITQFASEGIPFQVPTGPSLRQPLSLARSLRPLMRKVPSKRAYTLNEEATANQVADLNLWIPILEPLPERWLELMLVVEESSSTIIWQDTIHEFQRLLEQLGAFRDVRTWSLTNTTSGHLQLFQRQNQSTNRQRLASPRELIDSSNRRLVLLVSDCVSPAWFEGRIHNFLRLWVKNIPVAIVQLLPEQLWNRTALAENSFKVSFSSSLPGLSNNRLKVQGLPIWDEIDNNSAIKLPIFNLEAKPILDWSQVISGLGNSKTAGIIFDLKLFSVRNKYKSFTNHNQDYPKTLVNRFHSTASLTARRLAALMAAAPVSLPIVHLIQQTLLPHSNQVHVAEVFMSGLLKPISSGAEKVNNKNAQYDFLDGVRDLLLESAPISDAESVLNVISQYIADKVGRSINSFTALLLANDHYSWDTSTQAQLRSFAQVTEQVLRSLGGEYAELAEQLKRKLTSPTNLVEESDQSLLSAVPPLQTFTFESATIVTEEEIESVTDFLEIFEFEFEKANITFEQSSKSIDQSRLMITRSVEHSYYFIERLNDENYLDMIAIPSGFFTMGSPVCEIRRLESEGPQHEVYIPSFSISRYPITQAQWKAIASRSDLKVERDLDPEPSYFKGNELPVENISWWDAVEFCNRLCKFTGREYCLPSEAEWEYACRAGSKTPFHFGETITTDLANYQGTDNEFGWVGSYEVGPKGDYRKKTTPVGYFMIANAFGLYDMHGNVWEWCADHWHNNYSGAPNDGSSWESSDLNSSRILRGGSWFSNPSYCRSSARIFNRPVITSYEIGFRIICTEFPKI